MRLEWSSKLGPLEGGFIFLSASVPDPKRHEKFLNGPVGQALMLRVIDRRVDDAVQSLLAQTFNAGGRIVHGGHPKLFTAIAHQARLWKTRQGVEPPIRIYQSEFYRQGPTQSLWSELDKAGVASIVWVSANLDEIAKRWHIANDLIDRWLPYQTAPTADPGLRRALLAMRIEMLLDTKPKSAVCIGGMEGIQAEARLYLELAKMGSIPPADRVNVICSTYGASAQLNPEEVKVADAEVFNVSSVESDWLRKAAQANFGKGLDTFAEANKEPTIPTVLAPSPETAKRDIELPISYDQTMRSLVKQIASSTLRRADASRRRSPESGA
jgi:hypothetical protein